LAAYTIWGHRYFLLPPRHPEAAGGRRIDADEKLEGLLYELRKSLDFTSTALGGDTAFLMLAVGVALNSLPFLLYYTLAALLFRHPAYWLFTAACAVIDAKDASDTLRGVISAVESGSLPEPEGTGGLKVGLRAWLYDGLPFLHAAATSVAVIFQLMVR